MRKNPQERAFLEAEGNYWYQRNKDALALDGEDDAIATIKRVLKSKTEDIHTILEVGCGNGKKIASLGEFFNAESYGIDPSEIAIQDGSKDFPNTNLQIGTASKLPFINEQFDLVYFGFCLYLVDRGDILKAVAEADRVLRPGGYLAISDFDPTIRHKRDYHHCSGLFSYKTSYANLFTSSGHYYLVAKDSFSHKNSFFSENSDERVSISIMYKETDAY